MPFLRHLRRENDMRVQNTRKLDAALLRWTGSGFTEAAWKTARMNVF
ncbi:MAG: hypothetical protein NWR52_00350 [Paracoccaceae bacterium]|nr:hypothetical protein [Paracoccaceae bacterium]